MIFRDPLLRDRVFRSVLLSNIFERFAASAMAVLLGFQVFEITRNPLDLGWLGLIEAVPGIGLVLYGGHVADRHRRRSILIVTSAAFVVLAFAAATASAALPGTVAPLSASRSCWASSVPSRTRRRLGWKRRSCPSRRWCAAPPC